MSAHHSGVQVWDNVVFDGPTEDSQWVVPLKENLDPNPIIDIESEINEIEKEICRLSKKLNLLKIKKSEQDHHSGGSRGGRIVPAKFMTPPPLVSRISEKKILESPVGPIRRRGGGGGGLSLGPMEILTGQRKPPCLLRKLEGIKEKEQRRGMSLGPAEILSAAARGGGGGGQLRRKIQQVDEKPRFYRRGSMSTSPNSRKPTAAASKVSELRRGVSTAEKALVIKPKVLLFEESPPAKRPLKNAKVRIVASRYSLAEPGSKRRKWSLPEEAAAGKEEIMVGSSRGSSRSLSLGGGPKDDDDDDRGSPSSSLIVKKVGATLPRIRTVRCAVESPRDSGCAKRVADLVRKKSCFSDGGEILNLDDED